MPVMLTRAPSLSVAPCTTAGLVSQSLSVVLWLWDGSESPGQLGALCAMLTSSRKQSQCQQVKKQTTKGWAFGSVSCQDTRGLLFTSFGFQSHSLDLHLFRSYCVSFLTLLQVGLNPVPPLRWWIPQCSGLCLLFPLCPCGVQHGASIKAALKYWLVCHKEEIWLTVQREVQEPNRSNLDLGTIWTVFYSISIHSFTNSLLSTRPYVRLWWY